MKTLNRREKFDGKAVSIHWIFKGGGAEDKLEFSGLH
jgi:tartrate dehydratase alpha subunit/fumarate hydratase class I-like protein